MLRFISKDQINQNDILEKKNMFSGVKMNISSLSQLITKGCNTRKQKDMIDQQIQSSKQLLIEYCSSIGSNNQSKYDQCKPQIIKLASEIEAQKYDMTQFGERTEEAINSVISASRIAKSNEFSEIIISRLSKGMRQVMQQGFLYSVQQEDKVKEYQAIIQYSKDHSFDLYVDKPTMKLMLVQQQFKLVKILQANAIHLRFDTYVHKMQDLFCSNKLDDGDLRMRESKYFRISDLIDLLCDKDIKDILPKFKKEEDCIECIQQNIVSLMLNFKEHIDFDETAHILIENNMFQPLMENLRDNIPVELHDILHDHDHGHGESVNMDDDDHQNFTVDSSICFDAESRCRIIRALLRKSLILQRFDVTFEIASCFMEDLRSYNYLPIIDNFIEDFKRDTLKTEIRLTLFEKLLPIVRKSQANRFLQIIQEVIGNNADESIFKTNINPLRCGLMIIKCIDDIQKHYNFPQNSTTKMQNDVEEQIVKFLECYQNIEELEPIIKIPDYEGRDIFWYFQNFKLFQVLDVKVMDKFIQDKWTAQEDCNSLILDYSCSYQILNDNHRDIYAGDWDDIIKAIWRQIFTFNKSELEHGYKFHIWKQSMQLRYMIEAFFNVVITLIFQLYISSFNVNLNKQREEIGCIKFLEWVKEFPQSEMEWDNTDTDQILTMKKFESCLHGWGKNGILKTVVPYPMPYGESLPEDIDLEKWPLNIKFLTVTQEMLFKEYSILYDMMEDGSQKLSQAFLISYVILIFPFKLYYYKQLMKKSNRISDLLKDTTLILEGCLFFLELVWIMDVRRLSVWDETNIWSNTDEGSHKNFMLNVIWYQHCQLAIEESDFEACEKSTSYRFDYLLSVIVFFAWLKAISFYRFSYEFGPMFKMIQQMIIDTLQFMFIWALIITMYISVSLLVFSELKKFYDLFDVFIIYFDSSQGSWDLSVYDSDPETSEGTYGSPENNEFISTMGRIWHIIFILFNVILMLNFIIAILAKTYEDYDAISKGIYYDSLIEIFPLYQFHEEYGFITCAQTPFNFFLLFQLPTMQFCEKLGMNSNIKMKLNNLFCLFLYIPMALIILTIFIVQSIIVMPFAFVSHIIKLSSMAMGSSSFNEFQDRVISLIFFMTVGLGLILVSLIVDPVVFTYNLFTYQEQDNIGKNQPVYDFRGITLFEEECDKIIQELENKKIEQQGVLQNFERFSYPYQELNKRLQKKFNIQQEVRNLIYSHEGPNKFVYNEYTKRNQLNPEIMNMLNQFNSLKIMNQRFSDDKGMVDMSMLKACLEQVWYKQKIFKILKQYSLLNMNGMSEYEIYLGSLEELRCAKPFEIQAALTDDTLVLAGIDYKTENLFTELQEMQQEIEWIKQFIEENISSIFSKPSKKNISKQSRYKLTKSSKIKVQKVQNDKLSSSENSQNSGVDSDGNSPRGNIGTLSPHNTQRNEQEENVDKKKSIIDKIKEKHSQQILSARPHHQPFDFEVNSSSNNKSNKSDQESKEQENSKKEELKQNDSINSHQDVSQEQNSSQVQKYGQINKDQSSSSKITIRSSSNKKVQESQAQISMNESKQDGKSSQQRNMKSNKENSKKESSLQNQSIVISVEKNQSQVVSSKHGISIAQSSKPAQSNVEFSKQSQSKLQSSKLGSSKPSQQILQSRQSKQPGINEEDKEEMNFEDDSSLNSRISKVTSNHIQSKLDNMSTRKPVIIATQLSKKDQKDKKQISYISVEEGLDEDNQAMTLYNKYEEKSINNSFQIGSIMSFGQNRVEVQSQQIQNKNILDRK